MSMYGLPAGLLAFAGAGQGAQGGFGGSLGGALQAFGQAEAAQADRGDRELQGMIQIARLNQEIEQAKQAQAMQQQQAQQQQAYVQSLPQEQHALAQFAPQLVAREQAEAAFRDPPKPDKGTSLMQNLAAAGLQPGSPQYQQAVLEAVNKPQVQIDQGPKLPTGYTFRDPNDPDSGVVPLPGGPADPANLTTEQRNKIANARKTHRQLTDQIGGYAKSLRAGIPLTGKGRDKIATQREQIKLQLKNLYELGAITGPDEEILDRLLLDPLDRGSQLAGAVGINDPLEDRAIANLEVLMKEADSALDAAIGGGSDSTQPQQAPAPNTSSNPADYSDEELERIAAGGLIVITAEQARAELQRRQAGGITPQQAAQELENRRNERALDNRERRGDAATAELADSRTPGFLDYVPGAGIVQDIPDLVQDGFNSPEIRARRDRRERAAKTLVPYATAAYGGGVGAVARAGAGLFGRALGAGGGSAVGDAVGQAITQGGEVDPSQVGVAAVGGTVGQPVGEAIGAAAPAAVRALFRGGEAGRQGVQSVIDDAARIGEVPTVAQATQSSFLDGVEASLAKIPGAAGRLRDHVKRTTDNVQQNLRNIAQQGTTRALDAETSGQAIIEGVGDYYGRFQKRSGRLFDKVEAEVGTQTPVKVDGTLKALQGLTASVQGAEKTSQRFVSPFIRGLAEDVSADVAENGLMPIGALRRVRSLVGEKLANPTLTTDVPKAQLKQLYGAISDDIGSAAKAAGPRAEKAYQLANHFYRTRLGHIEKNLEPLIKNRTPERVFDALMTGSRSGPTVVRNIYKSLTQEQQDIVTGSVIRRLGRAPSGQQGADGDAFSFQTFGTNWDKLNKEGALDAIFKRGRYAQMGNDLNALARYTEKVKEASKAFYNPSGTSGATLSAASALFATGSVVASPVLGTGALTIPLILGLGAGGANISARLMTSPRFVRWLAQSTKLKPEGIPAHIGRLSGISQKEDPEVQEAIAGYMDMLQSPISQGQAEELPNVPDAQGLPAGGLAPAGPPPVAAMGAQGQDPQAIQQMLAQQEAQNAALVEELRGLRGDIGGLQAPQAPPQQAEPQPPGPQGLAPEQEMALRQQEMQLRQIEAANQMDMQRAASERQMAIMEQQMELLRRFAERSEKPTEGGKKKAKRARVTRDNYGRLLEAVLEDAD